MRRDNMRSDADSYQTQPPNPQPLNPSTPQPRNPMNPMNPTAPPTAPQPPNSTTLSPRLSCLRLHATCEIKQFGRRLGERGERSPRSGGATAYPGVKLFFLSSHKATTARDTQIDIASSVEHRNDGGNTRRRSRGSSIIRRREEGE